MDLKKLIADNSPLAERWCSTNNIAGESFVLYRAWVETKCIVFSVPVDKADKFFDVVPSTSIIDYIVHTEL